MSNTNDNNLYDSYVIVGGGGMMVQPAMLVVDYVSYYDYTDNPTIIYPEHGTYNNEFINLHTGHLTLKHDDISVDGSLIPVTISHYYASHYRDIAAQATANEYSCGNGWKLSAHQKIERDTSSDDTEYTYTDATGKRHYFIKTDNDKITDTGGLNLTFSGTFGTECYITDRGGNKMTFDSNGRLIKVSDRNENKVKYTYEDGLLTKITDSFGKVTVLKYTAGLLTEICDPQLRRVKFVYENNNLVRIEEPDGKCISYTYDSHHHITEVLNPDGVKITYTYETNSDRIIRTDKYATAETVGHGEIIGASIPESGEFNIFEYRGSRSTAVTDRSGIRHVYVFDEVGRTEFEYEDSLVNGTQEKGQVTGTAMYGYADKKRVFKSSLVAADSESENFITNGTFEHDADCSENPYGFTKIGGNSNDAVTTVACIDGTKSFVFRGGGYEKYLKQTIDITNDPSYSCSRRIKFGDTLVLSAWAKAEKSPALNDSIKFELRALAHYTDNTSETISASYDPEFDGWQYAALPIRINKNKTLEYVSIYLDCSNNTTDVFFDNIRLVNALADAMTYEEDLNETVTVFGEDVKVVQRITSHNGIVTTVTENNQLYLPVRVTTTDLDGNSFTSLAKYDANGNCIASQDYRGTVTLTDYTPNGQLAKTRTYHSASFNSAQSLTCPAECFTKEYNYDKNGEFLRNETDPRSGGIKTQYDYDEGSGLLNYVTDAGGARTTYAYDHASKAMTMVSSSIDGQNNSIAYGYTNRLLTAITHNGFEYKFEYDGFGRQTKITAGDNLIATNEYELTDTTTVTTTYASGESVRIITDRHQQPIMKLYTKPGSGEYTECCTETSPSYVVTIIENEYDEVGKVVESIDRIDNLVYNYTYDELGNIVEEKRNGAVFKKLEFDNHNRLTKTTVNTSDETLVYTPVYETRSDGAIYADNAIKGIILDGVFEETVEKDKHQRPSAKTLRVCGNELLGSEFGYLKSGDNLTGIVESVKRRVNGFDNNTLTYEYDNNGNITKVSNSIPCNEVTVKTVCQKCGAEHYVTESQPADELVYEYEYDGLNRLTRENNYALGKTYTYTYDAAGNILCKRTYNVTSGALVAPIDVIDYGYAKTGWKDRLTSYDGNAITYDSVGNPVYYRGHSLKWDRVRLLKQYDDLTFSYNANGIRTRKGDTYYELDGDNIISETTRSETVRYYYGSSGVIGFSYNGEYYYYEKNLQGDITGIYDNNGNLVGSYIYDAWGNCTITTNISNIAGINPFRYRGYYFDDETKLYYLKSRYYDPKVARFINADEISYLGENENLFSYNLFAYCSNDPINYCDPNGHAIILACILGGALVGAVVGGCTGAYISKQQTGEINGWAVAGSALGGGIIGGLTGWGIGSIITTVGATATGTAIAGSAPVAEQAVEKGKYIYYQVTSTQAIEQMKNTLQLKPIESAYNYVMTYQPTYAQAQNLGCRSLETVVRFSTNFTSFVPDTTCSVPGAMVSNIPGTIKIFSDIVEVGFK